MLRRGLVVVALAAVAGGLVGVAPPARAAVTFFVDMNDGSCDDANGPVYCNIQAAVNDADSGDTIQIAAGTYTSSSAWVVSINGLALTLSGAGQGVTVIDGEFTRGGIQVLSAGVHIDNLSVVNGFSVASGAGIQTAAAGASSITDVTVSGNTSTTWGGGMYFDLTGAATLTATRLTASDNQGSAGGGLAVAAGNGTISIVDSTFVENDAESGAAIFVWTTGYTVNISGSTFVDNDSTADGGAIWFDGNANSTLAVTDSTFHSNETGSGALNGGGAIYFIDSPSLSVTGSTFTENYSGKMGGAIYDLGNQAATISNSTFAGNTADDHGGAIWSGGTLNNLTVVGNDATVGGGIADNGTEALLLANSIVYGNTGAVGADCGNVFDSLGFNLFGTTADCTLGGDTGEDIVGLNPLLLPLGDHGGPTQTMPIGVGSPARDAADPAAPGSGTPACPATDQRGVARDDARCDIGAFEVDPFVIRYAGANRYSTAAAVSAGDFPLPEAVSEVFVATGSNYPDALAGAAVAGRLGAPLLLVDSGIPVATAAELTRLQPDTITILGGTGAVSDAVLSDLGVYGSVGRIFGANRYLTAVAISEYGFPTPGSADVVYVATGLGFADALAAGPAAAAGNGPVLLVDGVSLHPAVATEILRLTPNRIVVVGGISAVSDAVLTALDALQGGDTVVRISGPNRYATSVELSEDAFGGSFRAYVATGLNFPDALAGAAAAGHLGAPVLLVPGTSLPAVVNDEILRLGANTIVILGGTGVVSAGVEDALETLIGVV